MTETVTVRLGPVLVPKDELIHCDVAGIDCQRRACYGCEFGHNTKRMELLKNPKNLREMTKDEYDSYWFCIMHRGEGL